jgi:adenine-specific DNA-methyltransferase
MEDKDKLDIRPDEDLGFRAYRLARSNFKPWKTTAPAGIDDLQAAFDTFETPLVEGWQRRDLLTEILLMEGFPLDSAVAPQPAFAHNHVLLVTAGDLDHRLWICLDATIAPQTIAQLDLADKDLFICLDAALNDETKVQLSDAGAIHVI